jgi:uncharacterized membrane protein
VLALVPVDTFGYKLMLLLHILAILVAFAPQFVWPIVSSKLAKEGKPVGPTVGALAGGNTAKIHGPALILAGVFGFGLVGMSEDLFEFSQTWISIAMVLWFAMLGVIYGLMVPAEKKAAGGDEEAGKKLAMFNGIIHLLLLLVVIDMIWKPGFP